MNIDFKVKTDGSGYWSAKEKIVNIRSLEVEHMRGSKYGELCAFFDESWNISEDGLIYTDKLWLKEFRAELLSMGFSTSAVLAIDYSEQGMQGDDYVSMDVHQPFIDEFFKMESGNK